MSNLKNILIEKYTEYFIQNNPSYSKDDQATIDFCNAKLEQYYAPYISYIVDKKKISNETEELLTSEASLRIDQRERITMIGLLCIASIFSERPSLKIYTDELTGFDEIRYYFNLEEFERSIIPFLNYNIETNFIELIEILELNRKVKLTNAMLATINIERMEIKKDINNFKDKKSYNAQNPRAKKENEIEFDDIIKFTTDTFEKSEEEVTESIFKVLKSDVKSKEGMEELKYVLNRIINQQRSINGVSKSNFLKSIQPYIFLLFDNDQYGIKRKETFDEQN
ncbi:MAG: hypothetical protein ACK44S_00755, partial [Bacteroidota bacterium]